MVVSMPQRLAAVLCLCGIVFAQSSGVWLDVPFVRQEKEACGAASIAMVMQYWSAQQSRPADADSDAVRIQRALYSRRAHGIYASDLEAYLKEHGYRTFAFPGEWNDLRQHLEKGRPLIVALKPGVAETSLHYVVVTGLDWGQGLVMINDPAQKKLLKEERPAFEKEWKAAGNWTLLALPR